ncbi:hypothetical protein ACFL6H_05500 [Candidatus Latescibacterota bacterium]
MILFLNIGLMLFVLFSSCILQPNNDSGNKYLIYRVDKGEVKNPEINEASGIVASQANPSVIWAHNDAGDIARVFAIGENGQNIGQITFTDINARDWEDIAIQPNYLDGVSYLYIGDIGDNEEHHEYVYIYRVQEPVIPSEQVPVEISLTETNTIILKYPDNPHDAETLIVDPFNSDIYIVTKHKEHALVYRAKFPQSISEPILMEYVISLNINNVTGGDISSLGNELILKNYDNVYSWKFNIGEPLEQVFVNSPKTLPYVPEYQGEGICWDQFGTGYFTISEKNKNKPVHLYYYKYNL